jgi:uncharacterized protein (TIGR02391 family)
MSDEKLVLTFEPNTIEHLGVKMYSTLPPALAEMIANSYDACAKKVTIQLYDNDADDKKIIITDNGIGMSFTQVNEYFLRIGRNRRDEGLKGTPCDRIATGKKGLGKLALFGIGETITIETVQDNKGVKFILDWDEIMNCRDTHYTPNFTLFDSKEINSGTTITLEKLKRKTSYSLESLAFSLSMLFNFWDRDFQVLVSLNDSEPISVDNKLKYQNIEPEFEWEYKDFVGEIEVEYEHKAEVEGLIMTTEKPLKPGLRGITLFANGRMINSPEFFGQSESSHFFSYTAGWFNVDFVDNWEEDVISTNRQSIDWDNEKTDTLRKFLRECLNLIERKWRKKRKEKRRKNIEEKTKVDIQNWYKTLPPEVLERIEQIVNSVDESELQPNAQADMVQNIHALVPEYPYYHWRHLHSNVQDASKADYATADYYRAFIEAMKKYINDVRNKSESLNASDASMMGEVFGKNGSKLLVSKKYKKPDGTNFQDATKENIEDGQKFLSMGIVNGGRNPVSHEEIINLRESGLFTEKDCLDFLSLLSHLFKRLDDSEKP